MAKRYFTCVCVFFLPNFYLLFFLVVVILKIHHDCHRHRILNFKKEKKRVLIFVIVVRIYDINSI